MRGREPPSVTEMQLDLQSDCTAGLIQVAGRLAADLKWPLTEENSKIHCTHTCVCMQSTGETEMNSEHFKKKKLFCQALPSTHSVTL